MSATAEAVQGCTEGWEPGFRRLSPEEWAVHPAGGWYACVTRTDYERANGAGITCNPDRAGASDEETRKALKRAAWEPPSGHETWCVSQTPSPWRMRRAAVRGASVAGSGSCDCSKNAVGRTLASLNARLRGEVPTKPKRLTVVHSRTETKPPEPVNPKRGLLAAQSGLTRAEEEMAEAEGWDD